jgi:hypothetical protein
MPGRLLLIFNRFMWTFLENSLSNFFTDGLDCVIGEMMGVKYSQQCMDLEQRLKQPVSHIIYYFVLSVQP